MHNRYIELGILTITFIQKLVLKNMLLCIQLGKEVVYDGVFEEYW